MAKQSFVTGQVLTAQQVNDLQTNDFNQTVSAKTASYTLVATDKGTRITMSSTSATTITVNTGLFAAGDTLFIQNLNTGVCTITAGTATVDTSASLALAQHEGGTLYFTSAGVSTFFKAAGAAPSGGGMTLLSTTTLSGASTTISSIDQTYKDLKIVGKNIYGSGSGQFLLEFNGDTGNNYANSNVNGNGTTVSTTQEESAPYFVLGYHGSNNTFSKTTNFDITIPRYSETEYHPFNSDLTGYPTSLSVWIYYTSRLRWNNTAAITQLKFMTSSGTFSAGTIFIYGVK